MKQVLFTILSVALLLSVVSCGDQKKSEPQKVEKKQTSGDTRGYIFVASDNRLLVPDGVRVKEYIIKD